MNVKNKTILITGAGGGLGSVMAALLAEDVANAVLYLASEEASFINGVSLPVDGGVTCY